MPKRSIAVIDDGSRQKLLEGITFVSNITKRTLGVKGRNVAIDVVKHRNPLLTNDGISIAREIYQDDEFHELGGKLIKEAAAKTEDNAGDGTTTTMILMQALVEAGIGHEDPLLLRSLIEKDINAVTAYISKIAKPAKDVETLSHVATISCRDEKIGKLVAAVVHKSGDDGMISLADNLGGKTVVEEQEGLRLPTGYVTKQFINQPAVGQVVLTNPSFMITNMALPSAGELGVIAQQAMDNQIKVLVVIAQDFGPEFIAWSYLNWSKPDAAVKIIPVRFNTAADIADGMLRDIASVTGSKFLDTLMGDDLSKLDGEAFGRAKKFIQTKRFTTVLPNNKRYTEDRIKELKAEFKDAQEYQAENITERIARLRSACFTVLVGGMTETELRERKTRVKDALNAAKAAFENGVVPGGGYALYTAVEKTDGCVHDACEKPLKQLAANSSMTVPKWVQLIEKNDNIVDPAKVVIESIVNASAQAIQVLLCETLIVDPEINE